MSLYRSAIVLATLLALGGCAASSSGPSVDKAPMSAESKNSLRDYYARTERPKAFAFSPTTGKSWYAWGYPTAEETQAIAVSKCDDLGSPCELYAVDNEVVWKK